ncbi:MAG: sulfite exporter TauE/SafE family protein [bacterium]|nr:sulfite exporter TauE/SafE family protein [bacterium]
MFLGLELSECLLLLLGAAGIGVSKSGFAGVSMLHVLVFAFVFGAKDSTGALLPMLVIGDIFAIAFFGKQVQWKQVSRLLPPTMIGVLIGTGLMDYMPEAVFRPTVGCIILALTCIQILRTWRPKLFDHVPHMWWFAWGLGLLAGMTTMMANAAGPVVALYLLAVSLPKLELVGTSAWFFLIVNVFKLPFSFSLGLITTRTLAIDFALAPGILLGMLLGRWMVHRIPQKWFDSLLLLFTAVASLRLIGLL